MAGVFDQIVRQQEADETREKEVLDQFDEPTDQAHTGSAIDAAGETTWEHEEHVNHDASARTDVKLREVAQELLRMGLLEERQRPYHYRAALVAMERLNATLEPLDLCARADEVRGLVFLAVRHGDADEPQDDWSHPLVRKQRLNLEQTLLVAILRQYFIAHEQEAGTGADDAMVAVDELIPQMQVYLGESGSEARERTRVLQLLDQLKGHGLVSAPDSHERVAIRPMIAHLANPENLTALLYELKARVTAESSDQGESA
ncbi:protein of unknown function [Vreelandella subterranea]|uniref:DUF4194 domain-containing protein n=1 Tax=Vreelandella subterranea TaxID=416874 RepID=A0A1H9R328_9GAMM|nr:DUF4194 domain-containing protein [Halomonas subterranea]SER67136.1 protein of unknown function [Halomonas subterranea]